jgi:hypothetical protein
MVPIRASLRSAQVHRITRAVLALDGTVFLGSAVLNWGPQFPLGFMTIAFVPHVWQAGIGELVVGCSLVAAAWTGRPKLAWIALGLSVLGIAFGLSSRSVQGAARSVHIVLVPLAVLILVLLLLNRRRPTVQADAR